MIKRVKSVKLLNQLTIVEILWPYYYGLLIYKNECLTITFDIQLFRYIQSENYKLQLTSHLTWFTIITTEETTITDIDFFFIFLISFSKKIGL